MELPDCLRPSLQRRVVLAVVTAFAIVWVALLVFGYLQSTDQEDIDRDLRDLGDIVIGMVAPLEDPGDAATVLRRFSESVDRQMHESEMPDPLLIQLSDRAGRVLLRTPAGLRQPLRGRPGQIVGQTVRGVQYRVWQGATPLWTVWVAYPKYRAMWIFIQTAKAIWPYVLIAFVIILLTMWFAVRRGLRPLQLLSARIAARHPGDLSPLSLRVPYRELVPLVDALERLLSRLQRKVEREHAFVQEAAHELRTPIAVISAQAHVLAHASLSGQPTAEAERRMDQAVARASQLISRLLELEQLDQARALRPVPLDLARLTQGELGVFSARAMERSIDLSLDAPDSLPFVIDPHIYQAILQNLLSNALNYVPPGGRVEVSLARDGERVRLAVCDDGPGIAPDERERVFERFYRGVGHDAAGAGLGLAIVRQGVLRLHATLRLEQGLDGRGCGFYLSIPAPGPEAPDGARAAG